MRQKVVVSASRRTELLEFYPDYLCEKLVEIGPENIHTLVIWTRNPSNLWKHPNLHRLLRSIDQVYVLLTLTGLAGTVLEPHSPSADKIIGLLPKTIDFVKGPQRIAWRYDPLIEVRSPEGASISNIDQQRFSELADGMLPLGVSRIITSCATIYKKTRRNLQRFSLEVSSGFEQKGSEFINNFLERYCLESDIQLSSCVIPPSENYGCIDGRLLQSLHPEKLPCSFTKDRSQRRDCRCTKSVDIGQWFSCPHGCIYCYGNPRIGV